MLVKKQENSSNHRSRQLNMNVLVSVGELMGSTQHLQLVTITCALQTGGTVLPFQDDFCLW